MIFGLFKKRTPFPSTEQLVVMSNAAIDDLKQKWIHFCQTIPCRDEVSLAERIDMFAIPAYEFMQLKYPFVMQGGAKAFWLSVFTAVKESGTHPTEQVTEGVSELNQKYGQDH